MREFTYESLLDDYDLVQQGVKNLGDEHFEHFAFSSPGERDTFRADLLNEIRKDYAFKLLTLLEADVRKDFLVSLRSRRRDGVSRAYRDLCEAYRRETGQVDQQAVQACRRIALGRIFDTLRDYFRGRDAEFRRVCSETKGYFGFRNWYAHGRPREMPVVPDPENVYVVYEQFREKVLDR